MHSIATCLGERQRHTRAIVTLGTTIIASLLSLPQRPSAHVPVPLLSAECSTIVPLAAGVIPSVAFAVCQNPRFHADSTAINIIIAPQAPTSSIVPSSPTSIMRIYSEESKKNAPTKSPLSPTSSSSSSSGVSTPAPTLADLEPSSLLSQVNRVHIPKMFNKNGGQGRPNISMHKFISSKGKQMTKENGSQGGIPYFGESEYSGPRLPRYVATSHNFYRKRLSAIDKIQEELREMKQREDELRCERVRKLGLSYPTLNSVCDEDFTSDDQTIESSDKDSFHSSRGSSSNPDLSINTRDVLDGIGESEAELQVGGPRRKIPLIAMWEQRIQEKTEKK